MESVNGKGGSTGLHGALEGTVDVLETSLPATEQVCRRTADLGSALREHFLSAIDPAGNQPARFPAGLGSKKRECSGASCQTDQKVRKTFLQHVPSCHE